MKMDKLIASCFGIGYLQKGAGTLAALFCCLAWMLLHAYRLGPVVQCGMIAALFFLGVWTAGRVEAAWGHDSNRVVIDEWLGMMVALFLMPGEWKYAAAALVLFRFFDIAKPLLIRRMEALPGGWGVMLDDLLAGVYSVVILQLLIKSHLF